MNQVTLLREVVRDNRAFLEATFEGVTPEDALWRPDGNALPIAARYAHVVAAQDFGLHGLIRPATPLALGECAGRTGMRDLPPPSGHPWSEWGLQPFDIHALRAYAQAVYAASDAYLATLDDVDMERPLDLTSAGFGSQTVSFVLINGWVTNVSLHTGEISCLKGLRDGRGYPV